MKHLYTALLLGTLAFTATIQAAVELKEGPANLDNIQFAPVERTPEPGQVSLRVQYPNVDEVVTEQPVEVELRLDWFPLGYDSGNFPRRKEIANRKTGQSLHIFIDNFSYFPINEALFDAEDDHDEFFDQITEFELPFKLSPGMHILRAFPCRSFGESLKENNCSIALPFYYQDKTPILDIDLTAPYLTYNEPQGTFDNPSQPILLDFYINNCALSKDGYKVRVTLDGGNQRFLYDWTPYYIYGLKPGTHTIQLELINPQNDLVPGSFNNVTRSFTIESP
ncbi:MAG: hypothetical protein K2Y01_05790 [Rhabdochlamydiaceae bacterium]|nr:hypothetical protein [Rhabdochlamydiaceae bacterium]